MSDTLPTDYFNEKADVYDIDQPTGRFTKLIKKGLPCRKVHIPPGTDAGSRTEMLRRRVLMWPDSYAMPEHVEVVIGGDHWTPISGTFARVTMDNLAPSRRRCDIEVVAQPAIGTS